ncbi:AfsR/SARP family transcriptional regulator [Kutzneria sp. CA-103260]|uniref:AfsR/SARP family transcriptional regulator n=1 Tax=Kutzneria sp. CA-103260 TaxID=2802641 RepID=UPI001BF0C2A4|nr:BTAD domain-containing putative transcriptional regulator [Kutzneria sp. CA-103260]QUQ64310.1 Regulatory protein AfsR [Kutzneria sp. CA-103260]
MGEVVAAEFRVLGTVEALDDGHPVDLGHTRQRAVLAVLLVQANHPVPVDQFVDHVWGEHLPQRGRDALYSYVSRLRAVLAALPDVSLHRRSAGYLLSVDEATVDLHRFRQLITQAGASTDDNQALALFDEALALWRGMAFADLDSPWLASVRTTLAAERRTAELDRTDAALRCGRHTELLADLIAHAAQHPLDERLAGQVMLALYRSGRQADALHHYRHLRGELVDQLGTDPNPGLQQLHQQILTADPTLTIPAAPKVTPRQLPPAPAGFTGRSNELAALDITDGNTVLISALAGAGGIGKTWLALHWAHTHADRFPDGHLFADLRGFSPDSTSLDPLTAVRGFLDALGIDPARVSGGLAEHTARYRSQIAGRRMLIVLDNAAAPDQVIPLLPGTPSCTVIVTSRIILTPLVTRYGARHLNLDVLTDAEAHALLAQRLGHARVAAEPDAVAELIRLCGRYPLALSIIASRAQAHPDLPLAEFTTELRDADLVALDDADPTASLPAVLSWSVRGLTTQQRTVFALLGIAPGPDIGLPATASLTGLGMTEVRTVLRELVAASLLNRHARDRYAMHDLIRAYAITTANDLDDQTRETALRRVLDFYTHTAHTADRLLNSNRPPIQLALPVLGVRLQPLSDIPAAMAWFDAEHPALLAAQYTAAAHTWHSAVWQLAWALTTFHLRQGLRHDRLAVWRAALDASAHLPDPAIRIRAHWYLGQVHVDLGRHQEGIEHLQQALALAEEHHDTDHQAHIHRMLAWARAHQGDDQGALEHATRALDLHRMLDRPVGKANALNDMGWYAARLGDYDTARDCCQEALATHRDHHNLEGEGAALESLGYIDHHSGHHQEAIGHYRQALALRRTLSNIHYAATTLDALGHPHAALGEDEQARSVWREALELYRRQGRDDEADRVQRQLDALDG